MSTMSIRLPESLHSAARKMAKKDHTSINQFVTSALAEKLSALMTEDYLQERAKRSLNRKEFKKLMAKVPDIKPEVQDRF